MHCLRHARNVQWDVSGHTWDHTPLLTPVDPTEKLVRKSLCLSQWWPGRHYRSPRHISSFLSYRHYPGPFPRGSHHRPHRSRYMDGGVSGWTILKYVTHLLPHRPTLHTTPHLPPPHHTPHTLPTPYTHLPPRTPHGERLGSDRYLHTHHTGDTTYAILVRTFRTLPVKPGPGPDTRYHSAHSPPDKRARTTTPSLFFLED